MGGCCDKRDAPVKESTQQIGDNVSLERLQTVTLDPRLAQNLYPEWGEANKSQCRKFMSEEVFNELKDKKTPHGFTIARAINTGVKNDRSKTGCHAGDIESYTVFAKFFDQIIEDYHGGYTPDKMHVTDMNPQNLGATLDSLDPIISTRIRVARNIEGFQLAPGQNAVEEKLQVEELVKKVFNDLEGDLSGTYFSLDGMEDSVKEQFIRDHMLFKGNDVMQADSGYHQWFPKGRGIFVNQERTFISWINEGDHLRLISMDSKQSGKQSVTAIFTRLANAVNAVEAGLLKHHGKGYMKTDHLGMITCCPTNLGTGLRASVMINLPKLAAKVGEEKVQELAHERKLQVRGLYGEHSQSADGTFEISNRFRLGYSEVQLVQFMIDGVNELMKMENES